MSAAPSRSVLDVGARHAVPAAQARQKLLCVYQTSMNEPFEILDHTADTGFRAWGNTLEELFANCARAMLSISADTSAVHARVEKDIEVEGEDYETLLVNWLSEILYLFDTNAFAPNDFRVDEVTPTRLKARLAGEPRDPQRHPWTLIIKAVTYYELRVEQRAGRWEAQVFLDI
jgi:SHS2 domain-containing protein